MYARTLVFRPINGFLILRYMLLLHRTIRPFSDTLFPERSAVCAILITNTVTSADVYRLYSEGRPNWRLVERRQMHRIPGLCGLIGGRRRSIQRVLLSTADNGRLTTQRPKNNARDVHVYIRVIRLCVFLSEIKARSTC